MDIHHEEETSYTNRYEEAFRKGVEYKYCRKHRLMSVIKPKNVLGSILSSSAKASWFGQLSFDPYDLSNDDVEYFMPKRVAEKTPKWSDCAAHILTAARLYLN